MERVSLGPLSLPVPSHLRRHDPLRLYSLTSAPRLLESALQGGAFLFSSRVVRSRLLAAGVGAKAAALAGGVVGGAAQSVIMTPVGCVTTRCLKSNSGALATAKAIRREEGPRGFFKGYPAVAGRQISNWSSRR